METFKVLLQDRVVAHQKRMDLSIQYDSEKAKVRVKPSFSFFSLKKLRFFTNGKSAIIAYRV